MADKPHVTEPIPRPTPYAAPVSAWLLKAWRDAVHALDLPAFDSAARALGFAPDGKQTLVAFLRGATTIRTMKTPGMPHRPEVMMMLTEHLGIHDPAHTEALERVLADSRAHSRLVELLIAEVRRTTKS
jgi:hypothetical protein